MPKGEANKLYDLIAPLFKDVDRAIVSDTITALAASYLAKHNPAIRAKVRDRFIADIDDMIVTIDARLNESASH